jgi:hypothetical protein
MSTTKTKKSTQNRTASQRAVEPAPPEPPPLDRRRAERCANLLGTFMIIFKRDQGCCTPIESLILSLMTHYQHAEDDGAGLTLLDIDCFLEDVRADLSGFPRVALQ